MILSRILHSITIEKVVFKEYLKKNWKIFINEYYKEEVKS